MGEWWPLDQAFYGARIARAPALARDAPFFSYETLPECRPVGVVVSAEIDAVLAARVSASSCATILRRYLLARWTVIMVVIDIGIGRVGRVIRGDLRYFDLLGQSLTNMRGRPDRNAHGCAVRRGSVKR